MAEAKKNFPMLPVGHWWRLRRKFKQSIPGVVTDNYLATVLEMGVDSARSNVLPFLKTLGIIDEDGKAKERAKLWRDDGRYPEVCQAILKEVYPKDLLDAVPDPRKNRDAAKRWFANHTGVGDSACNRMAALYTILVEADPSNELGSQKAESAGRTRKTPAVKAQRKAEGKKPRGETPAGEPAAVSIVSGNPQMPGVSINLQIHISADASPDQIELIFAAMAKHIYKRT
jgi:hypothetical protein